MQQRNQRTAVLATIHEGNISTTRTSERHYYRQGVNIYLRPMERNNQTIGNRKEAKHGFPPANGRTNGTDQLHFGTIPPSIRQLSARQLEGVPTDGRIRIQQRLSRKHSTHTIFRKLRNQPRTSGHRTPDARKKHDTGRYESITRNPAGGNDSGAITTQGLLRCTAETRSEFTIRRYGLVTTEKYTDHTTLQKIGLQENGTIQNLGKDWRERL